jgi:hypothetical protein
MCQLGGVDKPTVINDRRRAIAMPCVANALFGPMKGQGGIESDLMAAQKPAWLFVPECVDGIQLCCLGSRDDTKNNTYACAKAKAERD